MRDEPKKRMRFRIIILLVCFYLGFMGIAFRTYQLQVIDAARLQAIAKNQYLRKFALKSPRGVIYDRNHAELAVNKRGYSIARTERVKDPHTIALKLARVLGSDEARLERKLKEDENFVWLERQVSEEQGEAIKVLALPGIVVFPEERRYYPGGDLAGQILGFTGLDGEGLEGMEKLYDRQLRGKQKFLTVERDNRGSPGRGEQNQPAREPATNPGPGDPASCRGEGQGNGAEMERPARRADRDGPAAGQDHRAGHVSGL